MKNRKKRKTIGGQVKGALIANGLYQAMLKKSLENEKWRKWQMIRMEHWKKIVTFPKSAKKTLLRPEIALFRSKKRPKTTV